MSGGRRDAEVRAEQQVVLPISRVRRTVDLLDELASAGLLTKDDAAVVVHQIRTCGRARSADVRGDDDN